ncbi:TNF receptor-associated factor 3-like [Anneissia japonica]|uniref:TNF receptor-associated factor 3-like n=1 Tax=Anneissia japonica TaxID=1529436 RepID=UPI001425872F|nr:TNF receptor-associated factor 3-like [Anneissia japonica]
MFNTQSENANSNLLTKTDLSLGSLADFGYKLNFFNESLLEDLRCGICQLAVHNAMQVPCGCRFCASCILNQKHDNSGKSACPNCNEEFSKDELAPDHHARRQILKAIIYCPHKDQGCVETFPRKELQHHLESCPFSPVTCLHHARGCATKLMRKDLKKHLQAQCEHRLVECQFCKSAIPHSDIENHKKFCPKLPASCPNDCGLKEIQKDMMEKHLNEDCPQQERNCKYQHYGCEFKGAQVGMEKHMEGSVNQHLDLLILVIAQMNLKFSESLRHISELESQRSIQHEKEKELLNQVTSIKQTQRVKDERITNLQRLFAGHADNIAMLEDKIKATADKKDIGELRQLLASLQDSTKTLTKKVQGIEQNNHHIGGAVARPNLPTQVQLTKFEKELDIQSVKLSEQDLRFQLLETASYDGVLLWKISGIRRRKQEADSGKIVSLYSQPFYTSRYGYKMCARIYLNGDGMGKGTHVSLFFVVMKGDYDALLQWPFNQKVTMILLDQETGKRSLTDSFKPDGRSSSFKRPTGDMNIASGCPLFVSQQILKDSAYVRDDTMFIKMIVDTSDLYM